MLDLDLLLILQINLIFIRYRNRTQLTGALIWGGRTKMNSQIVFIVDIEIMRSGYEYQRQRFPALNSWDQALIPIFCRPNLKNFSSGLNLSRGSNMVDST